MGVIEEKCQKGVRNMDNLYLDSGGPWTIALFAAAFLITMVIELPEILFCLLLLSMRHYL